MARSVDADVPGPRFDAERIQQPVIVVRDAVAFVYRDVQLVGALDELEALDGKDRFGAAAQSHRLHFLQIGVRAVTTDAVRVEKADTEYEVVDRLIRMDPEPNRHRLARVKHKRRLTGFI